MVARSFKLSEMLWLNDFYKQEQTSQEDSASAKTAHAHWHVWSLNGSYSTAMARRSRCVTLRRNVP